MNQNLERGTWSLEPHRRRVLGVLVGAVVSVFLSVASPGAQTPAAPQVFETVIADAMRTFEVPGMAVAVVKDGKTVLAKGYGVRRMGEPALVDERTQFGIASNSKVFTALALGLLVEEQKIAWDAPVVRYLPWFRLSDPYVTRELTVRDLLVHRSGLGLGAGDLLWWPPSTYTRREVAERLQFIPLATSFRSAYAYDNVLYLVAGEVIQAVSGRSWEDFVAARLLVPMGMTSSDVRHSAAGGAGNVAATHAPIDGKVRPVAPFLSDNTNPAGGIMSGAADMARWLGVFLARGELPNGTRLFTEATWRQLTTIVTPLPPSMPGGKLTALRSNFRGYALGLDVRDYRGKATLHAHGRAARLRIARGVGARDRARRCRTDQSGVWRGVQRRHMVDRGPLPRRQGHGLGRGV